MQRANSGPNSTEALINAWWESVLAGEAVEPHPVHGEGVQARFSDGRLTLVGEVESKQDRDELVRQARQQIGAGVRAVDTTKLRIPSHRYRRGILDQTLVAAFKEAEVADMVRKLVVERGRVQPKMSEVVHPEQTTRLRQLLPNDFVQDAQKALLTNKALLLLTVDETEAFNVRRLLEEDTRSTWTVATPPRLTV